MEFVEMTQAHISQVAALEKVCFSAPWSEASISGELQNPLSCWMVAMDGEVLVGYVGSQAVMGEADMMNLAVLPDYRRRGVGCGLVEALIFRLKEMGNYCLSLEVRVSNIPAISLYQALGFFESGRRPRYYTKPTEDALILRKEWEI